MAVDLKPPATGNASVPPSDPRGVPGNPQGSTAPASEECPACGNPQFRSLFPAFDRFSTKKANAAQWQVVECQGCKLLRLSPWPQAGDVRRHYPAGFWLNGEAHSKIEEHYRRFRLRDQVNFVGKALRRAGIDGPVLEVASRGGWFLQQMVSPTRHVAALDFDIASASQAWLLKRVPAACGSLTHAPFAPKTFAAIAMFGVLEHLYDPVGHLEAARTLLKPGGRLIVQVPNASCWQFLLLAERWNELDAPRHLFHYRASDLEILLDRCGFEVERTKYFALSDNPSGLAASIAPGLVPETRRLSGRPESHAVRLAKDLAHQALTLASLPITILEAACHAGSTVMMEARPK